MRRRCITPSSPAFRWYGARGIHVCEEWATFLGFLDWALCNGYSNDRELDRIDADGPYSPRNCRWTSKQINVRRRELDRAGAYLAALDGRLTNEIIENAGRRDTPYKIADGKGLVIWITATGKKSWRYRYRFDGKEQMLTIGQYPRTPLAEARELHAIAMAQVKRGVDPAALKQEAKRRRRIRQGV